MKPLRVLVVFGGRSGEREVSISSACSVADAIDELGHELVGVGITPGGRWVRADPRTADDVGDDGEPFVVVPDPSAPRIVDVAFPVLHGPFGEDGSIQGLFELADLPYVGAGVEGSALALNKVVQKQLFRAAGLPTVDWVAFNRRDHTHDAGRLKAAISALGFPAFAKPVRLGSSVGISRIGSSDDIDAAVERALHHDEDVIVEAAGGPHEIEVGVLGGETLELSAVGQAIPHGQFYDYGSKYREGGTELVIPALVPDSVEERLRAYATTAFRAVHCDGLARVDFFLGPDPDRLLVNEINSMPGLTPTSMFPRVWQATGRSFAEVVDRLLSLALERHGRRAQLEDARMEAHADEIRS